MTGVSRILKIDTLAYSYKDEIVVRSGDKVLINSFCIWIHKHETFLPYIITFYITKSLSGCDTICYSYSSNSQVLYKIAEVRVKYVMGVERDKQYYNVVSEFDRGHLRSHWREVIDVSTLTASSPLGKMEQPNKGMCCVSLFLRSVVSRCPVKWELFVVPFQT